MYILCNRNLYLISLYFIKIFYIIYYLCFSQHMLIVNLSHFITKSSLVPPSFDSTNKRFNSNLLLVFLSTHVCLPFNQTINWSLILITLNWSWISSTTFFFLYVYSWCLSDGCLSSWCCKIYSIPIVIYALW